MRASSLVALSAWTLAGALMFVPGRGSAADPAVGAVPRGGHHAEASAARVATAERRRLFRIRVGGKWGFIDRSGAVVLAARFDRADDFADGLASVQLGAHFLYVDEAGRAALEPPAPAGGGLHRKFSAGRAALRVGAAFGYMDPSGQIVIPARFVSAGDFSEGRALACLDTGCGYLDRDGRFVVAPTFMGGTAFRNGYAAAYLLNMMGRKRVAYFRRDGARVPGEYDGDGWFGDGLLPARHRDAWGFIDATGRRAIPLRFEEAWGFSDGLAAVKTESGRCGYIERDGALAVAARFLSCGPFVDGRALVDTARDPNDGSSPAFIDRSGAVVFSGATADPPFEFALDFADGLAAVGAGAAPGAEGPGARLGYVDRDGRYVWPLTE